MKQYLLCCNDDVMAKLSNLGIFQFIEVQGMTVPNQNVNVLVTPVVPPQQDPTPPPQDDCCNK